MNITNRQQFLGILTIIAVALWAGDRLVFKPLIQSWKDRSTRITEYKKSYQQGSQLLARDRAIREHWEHMRTNTVSSEQSIAEGQVLRAVDRWSQDSRISVTSVGTRLKQTAEDFATLECHVDGSGNLAALTRFLFEIEKDPLGVKVDSLELGAQDDRGSQLTLGLQVSGLQLNPPALP